MVTPQYSDATIRGVVRARVVGYHRVTDAPNPALLDWAVTPAEFDRQMRFLAENGYHVVTCSEMLRRFQRSIPSDHLVAITFDDGYLDTVEEAAPIMARYGFTGTVFAVAGLLGRRAEWHAGYGGEMAPLASAEQLRSLIARGWEVGHHTLTHAGLTRLSDDNIRHEVLSGLAVLTDALGVPIRTFAYPFSMQDARVRSLMVDTPFTGLFAAGTGFASPDSPREAIDRVFVLNRHTLDDFRMLLEVGMDLAETRVTRG